MSKNSKANKETKAHKSGKTKTLDYINQRNCLKTGYMILQNVFPFVTDSFKKIDSKVKDM